MLDKLQNRKCVNLIRSPIREEAAVTCAHSCCRSARTPCPPQKPPPEAWRGLGGCLVEGQKGTGKWTRDGEQRHDDMMYVRMN